MLKFFKQFPELTAILSEKKDGSMKIVLDEVIGKKNQENREVFFEKLGINGDAVISANLVHGNHVKVVSDINTKIILNTDALVTKENNILLAVTVSDCAPVFFYEKEKGIVALAHAGWRGIVEGILKNTVDEILRLGGDLNEMHVALGPGINDCHFEIKDDILEMFSEYKEFIIESDGKIFVDLKGIIKKQLTNLGINKMHIENDNTCTFEAENLFSYRRDKSQFSGFMIAIMGIKE